MSKVGSMGVLINGGGLFFRFLLIVILQIHFNEKDFSTLFFLIHATNLSAYFGSLEIHTFLSRIYAKKNYSKKLKKILNKGHEKSLLSRLIIAGIFFLFQIIFIGLDKFSYYSIFLGLLITSMELPLLEQTRIWVIEKKPIIGIFVTVSRYTFWAIPTLFLYFFHPSLLKIEFVLEIIALIYLTHYFLIPNNRWSFKLSKIFKKPIIFPLKLFRKSWIYFLAATISNFIPFVERILFLKINNYEMAAAFTYLISFSSITAVFLSTYFVTANQGMFVSNPIFSKNIWFKKNLNAMIYISLFAIITSLIIFYGVRSFNDILNPYINIFYLFLINLSVTVNALGSIPWMIAYSESKDLNLLIILILNLFFNIGFLFLGIYLNSPVIIFLSQLPGALITYFCKFKLAKIKLK